MLLAMFELIEIILTALVAGVFFGPWLGLSRSIASFEPDVFLAIGRRMIGNLAPVMPFLMPAAMLSTIPVLVLIRGNAAGFGLTLAGLALFVVALLITLLVEVPIDNRIKVWTRESLPADWDLIRDRWERFHAMRTLASCVGLAVLVAGALFGRGSS